MDLDTNGSNDDFGAKEEFLTVIQLYFQNKCFSFEHTPL
jgi:hypothetical protein